MTVNRGTKEIRFWAPQYVVAVVRPAKRGSWFQDTRRWGIARKFLLANVYNFPNKGEMAAVATLTADFPNSTFVVAALYGRGQGHLECSQPEASHKALQDLEG